MAKMNTQSINITVSELLPNDAVAMVLLTEEVVTQLQAIVQELVGAKCLVEVGNDHER